MPRPASDIQYRIVSAARVRFLDEGVDGASLREIARDASTNIGMIAYYFPTKDDLFLAVVEGVYSGFVRDIEALLGVDGSTRTRLRGAFVRIGKASDLELDVIRLVVRESLSSSTRLRRIGARFMRGHLSLLIDTIRDGVQNGELDAAIPAPLLLIAVMALGGMPQIARRAGQGLPLFKALPGVEALADLSIELVFRAVGARPRRGPTRAATR